MRALDTAFRKLRRTNPAVIAALQAFGSSTDDPTDPPTDHDITQPGAIYDTSIRPTIAQRT